MKIGVSNVDLLPKADAIVKRIIGTNRNTPVRSRNRKHMHKYIFIISQTL